MLGANHSFHRLMRRIRSLRQCLTVLRNALLCFLLLKFIAHWLWEQKIVPFDVQIEVLFESIEITLDYTSFKGEFFKLVNPLLQMQLVALYHFVK